MSCSSPSYRASLQQLTTVAQSLKPAVYSAFRKAGRPLPILTSSPDFIVPAISLPAPCSILATLLESRCPPAEARSLSDAFVRSANQIRDAFLSTHRQIILQLASDPSRLHGRIERLTKSLESQYTDKLNLARQAATDRAQSLATTPKVKPVFNQEFVPLLEKYFEYNAYPSVPDRVALAKKSMMTPRQIEVWFQNHRNRSKKEGKRLRRLTLDPLPLKLSLESLEQKMPFFIIPEAERNVRSHTRGLEVDDSDASDDDDQSTQQNVQNDTNFTFESDPPPHAFPTVYPPSCGYEPFPVKTGDFKFPSPMWMRKPATRRPPMPPLDFDDFVFDFSMKLVIREVSSHKKRQASNSNHPWFMATHVIPPPAPHPAFIRPTTHVPSVHFVTPLPTVPASSPPHPFRSPSPDARPATFASISQSLAEGGPARRKVSRLPRRAPKNASHSHRGVSPAISDASPSPSPSRLSSSRTSSFSSDTSDRRPSSSSSSLSSSTPTTPVLFPMSLPENAHSPPVSVSGLDFPHDDDLFGDSLDDYSHLNRLRGLDKQSFNLDALAPASVAHHVVP